MSLVSFQRDISLRLVGDLVASLGLDKLANLCFLFVNFQKPAILSLVSFQRDISLRLVGDLVASLGLDKEEVQLF